MTVPFSLKVLSQIHDREEFSCGEETLDRYFKTQVTQDIRRRIANCFVITEESTGIVAGYYTIASTSIPIASLPSEITKRLPRYPSIPAVLIGRLAIDLNFRRQGLGSALLADAAHRTIASAPAAYALVVGAKNDEAVAFYRHHGFAPFVDQTHTLFLPTFTATKLF